LQVRILSAALRVIGRFFGNSFSAVNHPEPYQYFRDPQMLFTNLLAQMEEQFTVNE
jgi:hypothetical protein